MATPTPKRPPQSRIQTQPKPKQVVEIVDPRWLLKALAATVAVAALFAYLAVCLLIYQGGWQRMIFPSAKVDQTPAGQGIAFTAVRFDAAATGTPRLTGWWVPGEPGKPVILLLHDAFGSLSATLPTIDLLHRAGMNVFAIDYRGFGQSQGPHPTEARMAEDAAAALDYLVNTRHVPAGSVVPYGLGRGASLAVSLANTHPELPAFVVENPDPFAYAHVVEEERSRLLPMRLLVRERFDLPAALEHATRPKLLIADTPFGYETARLAANQQMFQTAPNPKFILTFHNPHSEVAYMQALERFVDENVPAAPATLGGAR